MLPVLLLAFSVILFRIAPTLAGPEWERAMGGWSPLLALALCGGAFFPRRWAIAAGMGAVLVPHFFVNFSHGFPLWDSNLLLLVTAVATVAALGMAVGKKASVVVFLGASLFSTVLFHLVSNTVSFWAEPAYLRTWSGWLQAQTTGLPQYSPQTWVFSARQLAGDLLFTAAFVLACRPQGLAAPQPHAATQTSFSS